MAAASLLKEINACREAQGRIRALLAQTKEDEAEEAGVVSGSALLGTLEAYVAMQQLLKSVSGAKLELCTLIDRQVKHLDGSSSAERKAALMILRASDSPEGCCRRGEDYTQQFGEEGAWFMTRGDFVATPALYSRVDLAAALAKARKHLQGAE